MSNKRKSRGETERSSVAAHIIKADTPPTPSNSRGEFINTMSRLENKTGETRNLLANSDYDEILSEAQWITPPVDMNGYKELVNHSSILPQCIRAYKNNIAGFGIGVRYKGGDVGDAPDREAEWAKMQEVIELLNMDMDVKEVFENVIEARETYGIAYVEVTRNLNFAEGEIMGEVTGIEFIRRTPSIQKTAPLEPYVEVGGRLKKFCKYRQQNAGGQKSVYFKEIGDPRIMDKITGKYVESTANPANEILEFAIGTAPYGEIRWIGQTLGVDGSRKAENLNNRYFEEGRHTPLLIMVKGGTLTDDSFTKLRQYMNDVKGENGQHAFIVLETDSIGGANMGEIERAPDIEIHNLAGMLQRDELFQEYLNNNRQKVQSAFLLPDLYVGYTRDFNRATSQTAQEITEKQVFQPERRSLAWVVNNKLLAGYRFRYVEAYFKEPEIQNPDDMMKILSVTERAGGLTPNRAKELTYRISGGVSEDYRDSEGNICEWGDIPIAYAKTLQTGSTVIDNQLAKQIKKASDDGSIEIVAVMKEVRSLLLKREAASHE